MFNVYEVKGVQKWFIKSLGNNKFTAEVIFEHMLTDWANGHHLTTLVLIEE